MRLLVNSSRANHSSSLAVRQASTWLHLGRIEVRIEFRRALRIKLPHTRQQVLTPPVNEQHP